ENQFTEEGTCSVCYSLSADPRGLPCLDNVLQVSAIYSIWRPLRLPLKCPNCQLVYHLFYSHPYLSDCQLICGVCLTVGQHQGHPIDDLQAAFIRERQAPAHLLARLSDPRRAEVCELGEQDKASCEGLVRQDRQAVEQYFQGIARKKSFHGGLGHRKRGGVSGLRSTHWKLKELQVRIAWVGVAWGARQR
uniref:Uncharacterized protein n=1 Tax=Oncorhynchus tshawytscha TaxID=74940 RepID=A0A8C8I896_ONCTS